MRGSRNGTAATERSPIGLTNIQRRTITILIGAPLVVFFAGYCKGTACVLIFAGVFVGGLEWSGVKRHLKVALLMEGETGSLHTAGPKGHDAANTITKSTNTSFARPKELPLMNSCEYALPVPIPNLYCILKHCGWGCLAAAAYYGEGAFLLTLAHYFLIFVSVTLLAHNRLERKMETAVDHLGQLYTASGGPVAKNGGDSAERGAFTAKELQMIALKQPTEQFLDFCLDIFGIMWLSGLVYPLFYYNVPGVGVPWCVAVLLGNFANDIWALLIGKGVNAWQRRLYQRYDVANVDGGDEAVGVCSSAQWTKKRPVSAASALERYALGGTTPLYTAISPNKSVEGAIAGITANAITFALTLYISYRSGLASQPPADFLSPRFQQAAVWVPVGLAMGVVGVMGDLLQSLLKRAARVKDAGYLIPGHGGMLDRLDGLMLVFPFMFCVLSVLSALS